ncbi:MAG: hypothetical protein AAFO69_07245, partial [Bacteroidota bacterium]
DHIVTTVSYTNGTNYQIETPLPTTSSNQPILFTFDEIGWGGQYKIVSNVYSKNGWLCGQYRSDLIDAKPDNVSNAPYIQKLEAHITEFLVPLTQDTQYQYKQKLSYDGSKHTWINGTVPTATKADLSSVNGGDNLAQLVDITINQKAYQAGYSYRAANQYIPFDSSENSPSANQMYVMQNISVLSEETLNKRLKYSEVGFENQGYILYDTFGKGPTDDAISPYNFIIDPRFDGEDAAGNNACFYLRQVNLEDGTHNFGLDKPQSELTSYGKFTIPDLDSIAFHQSGYVLGASYRYGKIQILKIDLEGGPVSDDKAPPAVTLSGPGIAQGMNMGPVAMKTTPDGRILLLESINRRIQAFDVFGNPVPSFTGDQLFAIENLTQQDQYITDLDNGVFSEDLKDLFQQHGLAYISNISDGSSYTANLDSQTLTLELIDAFQVFCIYLTYNKTPDGSIDPEGSTYIDVVKSGQSWSVTDPNKGFKYELNYNSSENEITVTDDLDKIKVTTKAKGINWVITDKVAVESYFLAYNEASAEITVSRFVSYCWLGAKTAPTTEKPDWLQSLLNDRFTYSLGEFIWNNIPAETIAQGWSVVEPIISQALYPPFDIEKIGIIKDVTYLDIAVESKGYMYVLYYTGDGSKNNMYFVDIYDPNGHYLVTTPDPKLYTNPDAMEYIAAAKLTTDVWRNVFTLNYEKFQGPSMQSGAPGRTEPSISTWIPTPPDFTLPMSDLTSFQENTANDGSQPVSSTVNGLFSDQGITLDNATIVKIGPPDTQGAYSHFQITNGEDIYDVIVSISYGGKTPSSDDTPSQQIYVYDIIA